MSLLQHASGYRNTFANQAVKTGIDDTKRFTALIMFSHCALLVSNDVGLTVSVSHGFSGMTRTEL